MQTYVRQDYVTSIQVGNGRQPTVSYFSSIQRI